MNGNEQFLGMVQNGRFQALERKGIPSRLTTIQMQEAVPPESGELNLHKYEGRAIMVQGHGGGGWIYSARIADEAGPILTAVVQQVFGQSSEAS